MVRPPPLVDGEQSDGSTIDEMGYAYPGRTARQINARLRYHTPPSDVMVLAAGTNNITSQSVPEIKEEIRQTIENASRKWKNSHVIMCCIPHRHRGNRLQINSKIDEINSYISQEASKFANWHLLEHNVQKGDLRDGLHFSK